MYRVNPAVWSNRRARLGRPRLSRMSEFDGLANGNG